MTNLVKTAQLILIAAGIATIGGMQTTTASAATVSKPSLSAKGMFYKSKAKAKESARYRWGLRAADIYGSQFAKWGKAKGKNIKCAIPNVEKKLYRCTATAKPTMKIAKVCKAKVTAQGKKWSKKTKARDSAIYNWGLKTASIHGSNYAHFGKANNKASQCKKSASNKYWICQIKANPCN